MRWGRGATGLGLAVLLAAASALPAPAAAGGAGDRFPSADPDPRVGTPNDPEFDCNEPDDEDAVEPCATVWDEQPNLFGFAPSSTASTATYHDLPRLGQGQVSGIGADRAWKVSTGSSDAAVAVVDTGIRWDARQLRRKVHLNTAELPHPDSHDTYDADGDGEVTVDDYGGDPRVTDANGNSMLDGEDLILAFSDGTDADHNGYVDDIAGWDFFDDDNDPADTSSYSAAHNHGTGRASDAAEQTDDADGAAGVCPRCSIMPLRLWDSFVVIGDQYGMAAAYAADNGAASLVAALGVFQNTRTAKAATRYAFERGVVLTEVSSDLNTANHNYPTNYHETVYINGCVADMEGLGTYIPGLSELLLTIGFDTQLPVATWFRNSNLTQYGGHAHVCLHAVTGSEATGQAGGAAALLVARGREVAGEIGGPLTANEVKQLMTMTAEDVVAENTVGIGVPDPAQPGWDEHFGYGRLDLGAAAARIAPGEIPPEAWIDAPSFWALVDPTAGDPAVAGHVAAERSADHHYEYDLQWAPGIEPAEGAWHTFAHGSGDSPLDGDLGHIPMADVAAALPGSASGVPPAAPNTYAFTVRVAVTDADGNRGEDRKVYFAFHDPTAHPGWPRFVDSGGDQSPVLADLDGDGTLEVIVANSSGELTVTRADGTPLPSFNGGEPWVLPPTYNAHLDAPAFASGRVPAPTGGFRTPVVYDVDGDLSPEIVAAAVDGRLYVLSASGALEPGFPVGVDPALSDPSLRTENNHVKRGFLAAPTVGDLDGDGSLEIVAAALDGRIYVWSGKGGSPRPGFPVHLAEPAAETFYGGELISTPALADLDGDGTLEIVEESSEVYGEGASVPDSPDSLQEAFERIAENGLAGALGDATGRIYAVHADGSFVDGWPVPLDALLPDILPFVAPAMTVAVADFDGDGNDEVVAGVVSGEQRVLDGDGTDLRHFREQGVVFGGHSGEVQHANLAEYPAIGDLDGNGTLEVAKGGATLNTALNLLLVGQNLPYDHLVQAWEGNTGEYLPGYPRPIDDYTILSTPAIADVGGDAGREVVMGSGLYLLHAFGAGGAETPGFPKLAGGWLVAVPAIGDVDGDGTLELVTATREGWQFMWDLDTAATPAANQEWWTEAHDECHTGSYRTDCRPPARVQGLALAPDGTSASFRPSGDDWLAGAASAYEVRVSAGPIDTFAAWQAATPVADGTATTVALPPGTMAVAVVAVDDAGNRSPLASAALPGASRELPATGGAGGASFPLVALAVAALGLAGRAGRRSLRSRRA